MSSLDSRPTLLQSLGNSVLASGGLLLNALVKRDSFMYARLLFAATRIVLIHILCRFGLTIDESTPSAGYVHGRMLEEGRIHSTSKEMERRESGYDEEENYGAATESEEYESAIENESAEEGEEVEHPNARLQWTWTELQS